MEVHGDVDNLHRRQSDIVILIHGFEVSEDAACREFEKFEKKYRSTAFTGRELDFYALHWPGDRQGVKFMSQITYAARIGPAATSGERLAASLMNISRARRIYIVAHSLGNRVALQAVAALMGIPVYRGNPNIVSLVMLAAAVPARDCVDGGPFAKRYRDATYHVLASRRDAVLLACFPVGQSQYVQGAAVAVGRDGAPPGRWDSVTDTRLGHGKYWGSDDAVEALQRATGAMVQRYPGAGSHSLPEHALP